MKLALQFIDHNPYPRCGIFIKHASPKVWLQEIKRMQLKLADCKAYACPSLEANGISGVLLILKTAQKNIDVGNNSIVQKVHANLFIPENTTLNMALTDDEFASILHGVPHFFHHKFGFIELNEELDWSAIIQNPTEQFPPIESPAKGVKIPAKVTSFSIEIEEAEESETLGNPFGEEEVDPKDLPFDMKKVLEGNNAEVEKYLNYLEKNPDAALKMAIPLDLMGTSRGKAFAKYKFKSNFFESIGFGDAGGRKTFLRGIITVAAIILLFWVGYEILYETKNNNSKKEIVNPYNDIELETDVNYQENLTNDTDHTDENLTDNAYDLDNEQPKTDSTAFQNILLFVAVLALLFLIRYLINYRKQKELQKRIQTNQSWMDLPDESELFAIHEGDFERKKGKNSAFYFGGDEISFQNKILVILIIVGLLIYLFYPLFNKDGFPVVFGVFSGFIVLRMLYTLLNKNKKFDENDA